jgi:hypothetical protein
MTQPNHKTLLPLEAPRRSETAMPGKPTSSVLEGMLEELEVQQDNTQRSR